MNPQYTDRHLAEYYSTYTVEEPKWDEPLLYAHNVYLELIEKYLPGKGTLLDIGSGKGHLLQVARERGWMAQGYEIDDELAAGLTAKLGVSVRSGDFTKLDWEDKSFDVVVMHQVFEHLKDPLSYLKSIRRILDDRGMLFIVIPNIQALAARVKFFLEKKGLRKSNIGAYYDAAHHLFYFSPETLSGLLSRNGFDVLYMRSGHRVRPNQSRFARFIMRSITERNLLHSTFLCVARKKA